MKRDFNRLAGKTYDVLIIGGGVYGLFTAWDAALRGLSVALLEKGDFGHATSSNTLRVIHGGLRYLQHGDLLRLRHSIHERTVFMRIAPHLVHPLPFVIPTYGHALRGKEALFTALIVNDVVGFDRNRLKDRQKRLPSGRILGKEEFLRMFPSVDRTGLTGGAIVYDCQMYSSERLVISLARSAAAAGAEIANYVEVVGLLKKGNAIAGVKATDLLGGNETEIQARVVVNAAGPWIDRVLNLAAACTAPTAALSKAFNILVDRQLSPDHALGIYTKTQFKDRDAFLSKGSRLLFLSPWHGRTLIGTVHLPYDCDPDECRVTEHEIQAFLDEVNEAYPAAKLLRQDVCFTYAGLLPKTNYPQEGVQLVKHYTIRDHKSLDNIDGLISVVGVKFTEARHVAEKTVDLLVAKLGVAAGKSKTAVTSLYGGAIGQFDDFLRAESKHKPRNVSAEAFQNVLYLYGSAYPEILKYADSDCEVKATPCDLDRQILYPSEKSTGRRSGMIDELHSTDSTLIRAEVLHSIRDEMAQKLGDVVFRRTSLGNPGNRPSELVGIAASVMAKELNWNVNRTQREIRELAATLSARV